MKTKIFRLPPQRLPSPTFLKLHKNVQFVRMHKANSYAVANMKYVRTDIKEFRIAYESAMVWVKSKWISKELRITYELAMIWVKSKWILCSYYSSDFDSYALY